MVAEGIEMVGTRMQCHHSRTSPSPTGNAQCGGRTRSWTTCPNKVFGIIEEHDDRPSTRFKNLIDLVAIQAQCRVAAAGARQALENESRRRGIALQSRFDVPDYELWKRGYAGEARRTVGLTVPTVDDALDVVRPFLDPLLKGRRGDLGPQRACVGAGLEQQRLDPVGERPCRLTWCGGRRGLAAARPPRHGEAPPD